MNGSYEVIHRGNPSGTVQVDRQGLYYKIQCSCTGVNHGIYRLIGRCADEHIRLGVLIPEGDKLVLQTKIPVKKLNTETLEFYLESVVSQEKSTFKPSKNIKYIPIYPDEPYEYLSKLKRSYLEYRDGRPGIMITD